MDLLFFSPIKFFPLPSSIESPPPLSLPGKTQTQLKAQMQSGTSNEILALLDESSGSQPADSLIMDQEILASQAALSSTTKLNDSPQSTMHHLYNLYSSSAWRLPCFACIPPCSLVCNQLIKLQNDSMPIANIAVSSDRLIGDEGR